MVAFSTSNGWRRPDQTSLGELTVLPPDLLAVFKGAYF